jgi:acetyl esterase/lipase
VTTTYFYASRNFSTLAGFASQDPRDHIYDESFSRASSILTALDAGFWTAMKISNKRLRDIASILFSLYYLFATERAIEKVRKVRSMISVKHFRISCNKGTTPYLSFFQRLLRPWSCSRWSPRQIRIPRPSNSKYETPVEGWLYFDGPLSELKYQNRLILDIPGGGFVAMNPRCNDDKLFTWAAKSGVPILSLDYKKAPEFPYPYALHECFDVYQTIVKSKGKCIGMSGEETPGIIITGDSAGGNIAVAATLMILEARSSAAYAFSGCNLTVPDGLVCFYPALNLNMGNWMSDEQLSLFRDGASRGTTYSTMTGNDEKLKGRVGSSSQTSEEDDVPPLVPSRQRQRFNTRLAPSSLMSYLDDKILSPEMMRAMVMLYVGEDNRPDLAHDYYLSPVFAPDHLLAKFPKTYFLTGERDPLVDDTVMFAGRLRRAKRATYGLKRRFQPDEEQLDSRAAEVVLLPGVSHGFMQFPGIFPPAWDYFERCTDWFEQLFNEAEGMQPLATETCSSLPSYASLTSGVSFNDVQYGKESSISGESSIDDDEPADGTISPLTCDPSLSSSFVNGNSDLPLNTTGKGDYRGTKLDTGVGSRLGDPAALDELLGRRMHGLASSLVWVGQEG